MEHPLHLAHPYGNASVSILLNVGVHGHKRAGSVVLWPVELYSARYPRSCQSHECWLYDMVVVDEVPLANFVVCHLYASAEFRQHHYLYVFILKEYGVILLVGLLVGY